MVPKPRERRWKRDHVEPGSIGDLMRQIAALHAKASNLSRNGVALKNLKAEREKLERQAAELKRRPMRI